MIQYFGLFIFIRFSSFLLLFEMVGTYRRSRFRRAYPSLSEWFIQAGVQAGVPVGRNGTAKRALDSYRGAVGILPNPALQNAPCAPFFLKFPLDLN
jgi:hypothetical protein